VWFRQVDGPANVVDDQKDNFDAFVRSIKFGGAPSRHHQHQHRRASMAQRGPPRRNGRSSRKKQMRVATYRTSNDASAPEVIIARFAAGGFGSLLDNINRWRNMTGLPPIGDEKDQPFEKLTIAGADAQVYDLPGNEKHVRVAMVPAGDQVWFFRLAGPKHAVAPQIPNFDAFLKTVQFK
jgi:hypothetical protein